MKEQRRGRKIAMTQPEVDAFLAEERTCRVATSGGNGPHLTPLWFAWDGTSLWLNSIVKSQRWTDIARDPRVSVLVDSGHAFNELHGVELRGRLETVGDAPRTNTPNPELEVPERLFAQKYTGRDEMHYDGRHAWLRLTPEKIVSWDFRKM
ncbi:pyridoxamine 5'-phosphate oxidase family protein [Pseudofrankia inefficax]|uniref:Pyridoxamine 5'-phosphate oxidase-related FMN-binding protein n=1 Tax=Pseudofrankia inefficax (strain DSM 45817 / CECT 9037 / DDB 130130 / EuI1c) TaxID=298654 RepID=E3J958_PSEI1|nr:pyridoxamine 5'-phosphate oxidase family protein [Pseudofrankia inefficax]ADP80937.1 pyridoxamine 5'-phosphate oxidase-related FMN-binding protein [Pseudofrankia inefficax]